MGRARPRALDGLRLLRLDRLLWPLMGAMLVFVVAGESGNVVEVFLIRDVIGASTTTFGLLGGMFALGAALGAFAVGRLRGTSHQVDALLISCAIVAVTTLLAGVITALLPWAIVWAVCGLSVGGINAMTGTLLATRAPAASRGQMFSTMGASTRAASLVATALGGIGGALLGPQAVFVIAGAGCLLTVAVASPVLRRAVRRSAVSPTLEPQPA
jgi:MFS family permease